MPIYEYRCTSCGHHLEANQSFSDDPLASCPECSGALRKVFGSVGIVLKGSGFYRTDSRPASTRAGAGAGAGAKEPGNGSGPDAGAATKAEPSSNGSSTPKEPSPATTASAGAGSSGASGSTSSGAGSSGT